jgi:hypothetical protein
MKETPVCCCESHKMYNDGVRCPGCKQHDPANAKPILKLDDGFGPVFFAAIGWPVRLAIWVLRRYINRVLEGKRP